MKSGLVWFGFALSKDVIGCNVAKDQKGLSHKPGGGGTTVVTPVRDVGALEQGGGSGGGEERTVVQINENCIFSHPSPAS